MIDSEKSNIQSAMKAIDEMINRSLKAQEKFIPGTTHHSLLENRIQALRVASNVLSCELSQSDILTLYTMEDLDKSAIPLVSLIRKSEKAIMKLKPDSWQAMMLNENIHALTFALNFYEKTSIQSRTGSS